MKITNFRGELTEISAKKEALVLRYCYKQGTTVLLAALADSSAMNQKIGRAVLLAPVAFPTHSSSILLTALSKFDTPQYDPAPTINSFLSTISFLDNETE